MATETATHSSLEEFLKKVLARDPG